MKTIEVYYKFSLFDSFGK